MNPKADFYFNKAGKWLEALEQLRTYVLDCGLTEEVKWGVPCYTFENRNIALLHVFKDYCAVLLFKGALLRDDEGLLVQQTENSQAARQLRFTAAQEVVAREATLKAHLQQAIEVEQSGLKVPFKKADEFIRPEEFESELHENPALQNAFHALTPGRQRAYLLYFSAPKQAKTRKARIDKSVPHIFNGRGLND
ncbi:YdeI/OmpD-associated family protein [Hymenobacter terrenus]|uniref:YdeI/OmpD-associated family protein n=1 Tax=Hymenobacter terrenus TaxID=1629124 RepID=UPI000619D8C2|nr:YdeI/OmpD-associated family protein [Hymenobacter terrenus]